MARDPRDSYAYKKARKAFLLDHCRRSGQCDHCGMPMDYRGKRPLHRRTATIEHRLPIETHPEYALDTAYWQAWCLSCNSAGNRNRNAPTTDPGRWYRMPDQDPDPFATARQRDW
ncbi:MAG: hypothetical protein U0R76_07455 [Candidatus Nanopelagicales bacterium]